MIAGCSVGCGNDNATKARTMMREIKESDWKIFRQLHPVAVERYCQRVLDESERLRGDTSQSAHERYLAIYQLLRQARQGTGEFVRRLPPFHCAVATGGHQRARLADRGRVRAVQRGNSKLGRRAVGRIARLTQGNFCFRRGHLSQALVVKYSLCTSSALKLTISATSPARLNFLRA